MPESPDPTIGGPSRFDPASESLIALAIEMQPELRRFLTARLGDSAAAEDVFQDLYLRLRSARLPDKIGNLRAFLYKTAANLASDHRRGNVRRAQRDRAWIDTVNQSLEGDQIVDAADPDSAIDARRKLEKLAASIAELPPKCREVFVAHKLEGLDHASVADRLKISRKTVEKHMSTALRYLVTALAIERRR